MVTMLNILATISTGHANPELICIGHIIITTIRSSIISKAIKITTNIRQVNTTQHFVSLDQLLYHQQGVDRF